MRLIGILWIVALSASVVAAQPQPPSTDRRQQITKQVRALRAYTLIEQLGLDETSAVMLFPKLARWDDEADKLHTARRYLQRRLANADPTQDRRMLDTLIDEARANQRALTTLDEQRLAELRKFLTPAQTARLLVVLPAFERRLQNRLRRELPRGQESAALDELDALEDAETDAVPAAAPSNRLPPPPSPAVCDPFASAHSCLPVTNR